MGLREEQRCTYCREVDYLEHFFCTCPVVQPLWAYVENHMCRIGCEIDLDEVQKLFGIRRLGPKRITNQLNHYVLIAKMCISKYKYGDHHDLISLFKYEMQLRGFHKGNHN